MSEIISEITPLHDKDCFYIVDRLKDSFNYPIHRHEEFEINYIAGCRGARRVVGDSVEKLGDYDLVIVGGNIEHAWQQYECTNNKMREITIQFSSNLIPEGLLAKNQFAAIKSLLGASSSGVAFTMNTLMRVHNRIVNLAESKGDFQSFTDLLLLLHELAKDPSGYRPLASASFMPGERNEESRRVKKVQAYINTRYRDELRLEELSSLVGMTATSFSRFFRLRTGRTLSDYIIDIRMGHATRMLVDTAMSIAEICFDCGFNNISNFNRIFKSRKGMTPKEFRVIYKRNKSKV